MDGEATTALHQFEKRSGHHCWDQTEGRLPPLTGHMKWREPARWALHTPPLHTPHALYVKGQCLLSTRKKKSKLAKFILGECVCVRTPRADPQAECAEVAALAIKRVTYCPSAWWTAATQHPE